MRYLYSVVCAVALALSFACSHPQEGIKEDIRLVPQENFDSIVNGEKVSLYTLRNGGLTMQVCNYGARVVTLFVPDRNGNLVDVVLGHDSLRPYIDYKNERVLGCVVGPVANRICNAEFTLDGQTYHLEKSLGGVGTNHSGFKALDGRVWDVKEVCDTAITLHVLHHDGENGFPGNLDIDMILSLTHDSSFRIDYRAHTDKTCPVNLSHHSYFNLSGEENDTIDTHVLYVNADYFTGIHGPEVIETPIPVEGTDFDFRKPSEIGRVFTSDFEQAKAAGGIDQNFCINRTDSDGISLDASLYYPKNGIMMEVYSDQPGLQVCLGQYSKGEDIGKYGNPIRYKGTVILETQKWPDAPNKPDFPNVFLHPGEEYTHTCIYHFLVK